MLSFKNLDKELKSMNGKLKQRKDQSINLIRKFYEINADQLHLEDLQARKRDLRIKRDIYKSVKLPTAITVLYGVIISFTTLLYTEYKAQFYDKFIVDITSALAEKGYTLEDVAVKNNELIQSQISSTKSFIIYSGLSMLILIAIYGVICYYLLLRDHIRQIDREEIFEFELSVINTLLNSNDVTLRINNNSTELTYKLIAVKSEIE